MNSFFQKFSKAIWNIKDKIFKSNPKSGKKYLPIKSKNNREIKNHNADCLRVSLNRASKNSNKKYARTKGFSIPSNFDFLIKKNVADSFEINIAKFYLRLKNKFIQSQKNKAIPQSFMPFKVWNEKRIGSLIKAV